MNKKPQALIALASALITFGVLFVTVGKPRYLEHHMKHHQHGCGSHLEETPSTTNCH